MKNLLFILLLVPFFSFSQTYGEDVPGADLYSGQCRIDYVNAYRDGKACAEGSQTQCGINQPTNSPECKAAQYEGYAAGYEAGNIYSENDATQSGGYEGGSVIDWINDSFPGNNK